MLARSTFKPPYRPNESPLLQSQGENVILSLGSFRNDFTATPLTEIGNEQQIRDTTNTDLIFGASKLFIPQVTTKRLVQITDAKITGTFQPQPSIRYGFIGQPLGEFFFLVSTAFRIVVTDPRPQAERFRGGWVPFTENPGFGNPEYFLKFNKSLLITKNGFVSLVGFKTTSITETDFGGGFLVVTDASYDPLINYAEAIDFEINFKNLPVVNTFTGLTKGVPDITTGSSFREKVLKDASVLFLFDHYIEIRFTYVPNFFIQPWQDNISLQKTLLDKLGPDTQGSLGLVYKPTISNLGNQLLSGAFDYGINISCTLAVSGISQT
jgi:hypothetical protein